MFKNINTQEEAAADGCKISGCSAQLCVDATENTVSSCEWQEIYACYHNAKCERQSNGKCGWTENSELKTCLGVSL